MTPAATATRTSWIWAGALVALATLLRLIWVLAVPTVPVSDFAMYRESANYLSEFRHLDPGFIYMPGFVALLALIKDAGGDLLAQKLLGVLFGGIGAAGVFGLTWALLDRTEDPVDSAPGWRRFCPCPHAALATALYAAWPAGTAMASVVGTDVPAAALVVAALALLATLAPRRPWTAALAFGATMGLAAWIRAVALPLTALSVGVWLARRKGVRRALLLTATSVAATLVVLAPWGIRHLRASGSLYFTDDHGGITALIGANPNSEGTYTRALNRMFNDVTGRSVLDEPHHQTDQIAYGIVREWWHYEPGYALGLAVTKAERLFDPEDRLFYWPLFRPGVLVGRAAGRAAAHHDTLAAAGHAFGLAVLVLALLGIGTAAAQRRWSLLALLPFQLSLAATYTIFFAEPRYRLPIEMLAFPFVALALAELVRVGRALARRSADLARAPRPLAAGLALVVAWWIGWPRIVEAGQLLRQRHRWAASEVSVAGEPRPRLLLWRAAPPLGARSPLAGAPEGVHLRAEDDGKARAQVALAGGPLAAGTYAVSARLTAQKGGGGRVSLAGTSLEVAAGQSVQAHATVAHGGGMLRFDVTLAGAPGAELWIDQLAIGP